MPLGIERINARRHQPNSRIVFIKPLEGPDKAFAQDFLERIAAICHPIMKANHLAIMSLEEYEPNTEFVGRNFNAGEVIQLVLKAPFTGHWLSFRSVQMVMMHELAHCVQMNHSGAFWKVRNQFAGELRELWGRGYTGDGFWSRGKTLLSGQYETTARPDEELMPKSLCGGTFRTSRGKRKRKGESGPAKSLTYAQRQQRRIARKFGTNGITLGNDVETRVKLEDGKKAKGKPRVAGSMRGRELRAAAALARFGQAKEEHIKGEDEHDSDSETESEYEDIKVKVEAVDHDGSKILDGKGHTMVKVCEDEDRDSVDVQREMRELQELNHTAPSKPLLIKQEEESTASEVETESDDIPERARQLRSTSPKPEHSDQHNHSTIASTKKNATKQNDDQSCLAIDRPTETEMACPMCSMTNTAAALTCLACSNVLNPDQVPNHWRCRSLACSESLYLNSGDCGICGVCGGRRPAFVGD